MERVRKSVAKTVDELRPFDDTSMQVLAEYMKLMQSENAEYNAKFPNTSNVVRYYKQGEGRRKMCKVVDEYAKEYAEEHTKEYAEDVVESLVKRGVSDDIIQEATKLSLEEIAALKERLVTS